MINYNGCEFESSIAGLFYIDKDWIHPTTLIETYEIILVLEGTVCIEEDGKEYVLNPNDMILLEPGKMHGGFRTSTGVTSFYWAHFYASDITILPALPKLIVNFKESHIFKEYLHFKGLSNCNAETLDIFMLNLIAKISRYENSDKNSGSSKLANEVYEYIKLNAGPDLTMEQISGHFGVTHEHLSRVVSRQFGIGMKKINNDFIIAAVNNTLANTNHSVKEIAHMHKFDDINVFLKFYKYHTGITPTRYRNMYCSIYMNNN